MAAAQVSGTPAAAPATVEAAASAVETPSEGGSPEASLSDQSTDDAILDALAKHVPPGDDSAPAAASEADAEKPEPKPDAKPAKPKRAEIEAKLFAPEALRTPEGVAKAADYLERKRSKSDAIDIRQKEQAATLQEQTALIQTAYDEKKTELEAGWASLEADRARARTIAEVDDRLRNGSIEEMLDTLGKLRGASGLDVWKAMSKVAIEGKLSAGAAPEVRELQKQVRDLSHQLSEREQRERQREDGAMTAEEKRLESAVTKLEQVVISLAGDASKHPELAKYVKLGLGEDVVKDVVRLKAKARAEGKTLDNAGALATIELELKKLSPAGASPARSEVAGKSASAPAGVNPVSPAAASAVDVPITGIAPSQTRSAGGLREKTQAELDADLARDTSFLSTVLGTDIG